VAASPSTDTRSCKIWSVPGKVFLLGEYAVLAGAPALVAAVPPRFRLSSAPFEGSIETSFHPESPAGRWCRVHHAAHAWHFEDPACGAGGFGASTAQFILAAASNGQQDWRALWTEYRSLNHSLAGSPPSGADLVAQVLGGVVEFQSSAIPQAHQRGGALESIAIAVIQASMQPGRKTATHSHLLEITPAMLEKLRVELQPLLERALPAFARGDSASFGASLALYADVLSQFDLEIGPARADRDAIAAFPGILGAKGTGALQSDALIAVYDPTRLDLEAFRGFLAERNLRLWCDRLELQPGLEASP
jgi:mevalonate kinase